MNISKTVTAAVLCCGLVTSASAWTKPTHSEIVKDALKYMGTTNATAEQKFAYSIYVRSAGSEERAASILAKAVADVDDFEDTHIGAWWVGGYFNKPDDNLADIASGVGLDAEAETLRGVNYTSWWHFLDFKSGAKDNHGNLHGGYNASKAYDSSTVDKLASLYLYNRELDKDDYDTTEKKYRLNTTSVYSRDYDDFQDMAFQPVSNLGTYWFNEFKKSPTFTVIGHSLHAVGDAAQPHHVYVTIGNDHGGWESWVENEYARKGFANFSKVKQELENYNAQSSFSDITVQTGEQAFQYPLVLSDKSEVTRTQTAEKLIPVAIAASVTVLTKGINVLLGKGGK